MSAPRASSASMPAASGPTATPSPACTDAPVSPGSASFPLAQLGLGSSSSSTASTDSFAGSSTVSAGAGRKREAREVEEGQAGVPPKRRASPRVQVQVRRASRRDSGDAMDVDPVSPGLESGSGSDEDVATPLARTGPVLATALASASGTGSSDMATLLPSAPPFSQFYLPRQTVGGDSLSLSSEASSSSSPAVSPGPGAAPVMPLSGLLNAPWPPTSSARSQSFSSASAASAAITSRASSASPPRPARADARSPPQVEFEFGGFFPIMATQSTDSSASASRRDSVASAAVSEAHFNQTRLGNTGGVYSELGSFEPQRRTRAPTRLADVVDEWGLLTEMGPVRASDLQTMVPTTTWPAPSPPAPSSTAAPVTLQTVPWAQAAAPGSRDLGSAEAYLVYLRLQAAYDRIRTVGTNQRHLPPNSHLSDSPPPASATPTATDEALEAEIIAQSVRVEALRSAPQRASTARSTIVPENYSALPPLPLRRPEVTHRTSTDNDTISIAELIPVLGGAVAHSGDGTVYLDGTAPWPRLVPRTPPGQEPNYWEREVPLSAAARMERVLERMADHVLARAQSEATPAAALSARRVAMQALIQQAGTQPARWEPAPNLFSQLRRATEPSHAAGMDTTTVVAAEDVDMDSVVSPGIAAQRTPAAAQRLLDRWDAEDGARSAPRRALELEVAAANATLRQSPPISSTSLEALYERLKLLMEDDALVTAMLHVRHAQACHLLETPETLGVYASRLRHRTSRLEGQVFSHRMAAVEHSHTMALLRATRTSNGAGSRRSGAQLVGPDAQAQAQLARDRGRASAADHAEYLADIRFDLATTERARRDAARRTQSGSLDSALAAYAEMLHGRAASAFAASSRILTPPSVEEEAPPTSADAIVRLRARWAREDAARNEPVPSMHHEYRPPTSDAEDTAQFAVRLTVALNLGDSDMSSIVDSAHAHLTTAHHPVADRDEYVLWCVRQATVPANPEATAMVARARARVPTMNFRAGAGFLADIELDMDAAERALIASEARQPVVFDGTQRTATELAAACTDVSPSQVFKQWRGLAVRCTTLLATADGRAGPNDHAVGRYYAELERRFWHRRNAAALARAPAPAASLADWMATRTPPEESVARLAQMLEARLAQLPEAGDVASRSRERLDWLTRHVAEQRVAQHLAEQRVARGIPNTLPSPVPAPARDLLLVHGPLPRPPEGGYGAGLRRARAARNQQRTAALTVEAYEAGRRLAAARDLAAVQDTETITSTIAAYAADLERLNVPAAHHGWVGAAPRGPVPTGQCPARASAAASKVTKASSPAYTETVTRNVAYTAARLPAPQKRAFADLVLVRKPWSCVEGCDVGGEKDDECGICQDEYDPEDGTAVTPCKHMFHGSCIDSWHATPAASTCPMCRRDLSALPIMRKCVDTCGGVDAVRLWMEAPVDVLHMQQGHGGRFGRLFG